ncbi:MAG TPA: thioesterase family protein [Thermoanaerobaculia bacterium]|jgi:YbgC/YbaW family acyl-CoA thioester hydrolase
MRFSVSEYVRWEDIDAAGIINYQAYLRFFGLAEVELFRSCGLSYKTLSEEIGIWLPRVHVECDFFHPVTLDELLVVDAYFGHLGTSSLHVNFEVRCDSAPANVVAKGKYIVVSVKKGEFAPTPIPPLVREKIAAYVEPAVRSR